jgi:hypothetical protein
MMAAIGGAIGRACSPGMPNPAVRTCTLTVTLDRTTVATRSHGSQHAHKELRGKEGKIVVTYV